MITRCNHSFEKINPFVRDVNWYDILCRIAKTSFHKDLSKDIPWADTMVKCNNSKDAFIPNLEEEVTS